MKQNQNLAYIANMQHDTTLTAWFKLKKHDSFARQSFYQDIPKYYKYTNKQWVRKKNSTDSVGRIYSISPNMGEKNCLRLLLLRIPGAISFEDLKTFESVKYDTFKEASIATGLLKTDKDYENCFKEAVSYQSPFMLRMIFCTLIMHCDLTNPYQLWQQYKYELTEDIFYKLNSKFPYLKTKHLKRLVINYS